MKFINYIQKFNKFEHAYSINEMASSLTSLGVPKHLMQFIHKLSGELHKMSQHGDISIHPTTGAQTRTFHTRKEPYKAKGGPWPEREDIPLSHDVRVIGTKKGKNNIYHYLVNILDSRKDVGIKLILVNPTLDIIQYMTRKTGKMSKAQLADIGIVDSRERSATDIAREHGISNKRGLYIRVIAIDGDSGNPISAWEGTIGQMAEDWDENTVLYIMEDEDRVRQTRANRKQTVTDDEFIKYFVDNFNGLINSSKLDNSPKAIELRNKLNMQSFDTESIKPDLNNFLELAFKEGEYENKKRVNYRDVADLSEMIYIHGMSSVASMFLHYIIRGKTNKKFYTGDIFKELGIDDLLF